MREVKVDPTDTRKDKRYRMKVIEQTLDHPQSHHLTLIVESDEKSVT